MNRPVLFVALAAAIVSNTAIAQSASIAEQYLLAAINQERSAYNLNPLRLNPALQQAATAHAQQMIAERAISHQFPGELELPARASRAGAHFARITENVAEGPSAVTVHKALMRSSGHRANILDPAVDAAGIAVLVRDGQLYAVEDFQATVKALSLDQQEAAVAMLLDAAGLELMPNADARQTCSMPTGYAGHTQPTFIVHFTTNDLSRLPNNLAGRLATAHDRRAAVGACGPLSTSTFTQYNLAVMLYP